jgi:hypothetical protein
MRTADLCPTCATFTNALCVLYNGAALTNTNIQPLDTLSTALTKINNNLVPETGIVAPTTSAVYLGQNFLNTASSNLYYAGSVGNGSGDWIQLSTIAYVNSYAQTLANLSNSITSDAASTTKYPSVNAIKGYIDQFRLTNTSIISLTLANTVITTSFTQVSGVTSPGSLAVPTSPVSGVKYIVWNTSSISSITINTTDTSVFFGQGNLTPGSSFIIPYLSIFSFTYIAGAGWLVSDLTIVSSTLVYSNVTIGASVTFTPKAAVTSISGTIGVGGNLLFSTNLPQIPEFIINNAASNNLTVNRSGSDIFFGPTISGTVTTLTLSPNTWTSFRYVAAGGWLVTTVS